MTLGLSPVPPMRQAPVIIPQHVPVYRVLDDKGFFGPNDTLFPRDSIISYVDEPNPEMEPLNSLAEEAMKKYLGRLDKEGRKVAQRNGTAFTSLADAFEQARTMAQQESKTVHLIGGAAEMVPLMAGKKKDNKVSRIELESQPPVLGASKANKEENND